MKNLDIKTVTIELTKEQANLVACVLSQQVDERGDDLSIINTDEDELKDIETIYQISQTLFKKIGVL